MPELAHVAPKYFQQRTYSTPSGTLPAEMVLENANWQSGHQEVISWTGTTDVDEIDVWLRDADLNYYILVYGIPQTTSDMCSEVEVPRKLDSGRYHLEIHPVMSSHPVDSKTAVAMTDVMINMDELVKECQPPDDSGCTSDGVAAKIELSNKSWRRGTNEVLSWTAHSDLPEVDVWLCASEGSKYTALAHGLIQTTSDMCCEVAVPKTIQPGKYHLEVHEVLASGKVSMDTAVATVEITISE